MTTHSDQKQERGGVGLFQLTGLLPVYYQGKFGQELEQTQWRRAVRSLIDTSMLRSSAKDACSGTGAAHSGLGLPTSMNQDSAGCLDMFTGSLIWVIP